MMKIYFGDNQFLSVNHSGDKVAMYKDQFRSYIDIANILEHAWDSGIRDFAFTVTPETVKAVNYLSEKCPFNLHPALPYAQYVNTKLTEGGVISFVMSVIRGSGFFNIIFSIIMCLFGQRKYIMAIGIRSFLSELPIKRISSISLLNVATDLFLGARRYDVLNDFCMAVRTIGKEPLFYTMNPVILMNHLWKGGHNSDVGIVFNLNEKGFRVNPNLKHVIKSCENFSRNKIFVMSIYSGKGGTDPNVFIRQFDFVNGVVFGSSNPARITSNYKALSD
jgi:hypothetical protein